MPLDPKHLPATVTFFTSAAWQDLRRLIEEQRPEPPMITADALHAASQFRRGEGYDMCLRVLLKEAGAIAQPTIQPPASDDPANADPMGKAMEELMRAGEYIDTAKD